MASTSNDSPNVATPLINKDDDDAETCGSCIAAEYRVRNFRLEYSYPGAFAQSQCGNQIWYIVWKVFGVIFTVSITAISIALASSHVETSADSAKWLIYQSNWSLLMLTASAVVEFVIAVHVQQHRQHLITGKPGSHQMPWELKLCWVLYNISTPAAFFATIIFWSVVHTHSSHSFLYLSLLSHGLNAIYALLNLIITAIPSRILHFYQPLGYALLYVIFTAIYQLSGGTNYQYQSAIYPVFDWYRPGMTLGFLAAVVVLVVAMHGLVCIIAFLRALVVSKFKTAHEVEKPRTVESYQLQSP
ncbi:protein rolling stone-like isoform X2 [Gigantopelta aegis]|nr:protein rolling stone-like isoform X2 [Gigantopelta aegis]XP_041349773.1 protein rolling stone-like isoform X2 [Gigantopelta aegis]XP_041349774.1 protein rolling stone-like isoform X2 [Gigantopelta aegis]